MTKYGYAFQDEAIDNNLKRLTNQLWKLIPMRENNEPWLNQLQSLQLELVGLGEIYNNNSAIITLLSKIEGLIIAEHDFALYRKTVFEAISLLRSAFK